MPDDRALRDHLIELLHGGHAHTTLDDAVKGLSVELAGLRLEGTPHSAWELLEHIRIALEDIVRFSQSASHRSPPWPKGYWPSSPAPADEQQWSASVQAVRELTAEFEKMVTDPASDLFAKFPWGDGQTLLREAMLIADHNAYHVGQIVLVRRLLGNWES